MKKDKVIPFIQKIDIFPKSPLLSFDNQKIFKTNIGGFMAIVMIVLILFIIGYLGRELFQRNSPFILSMIVPSQLRPNLTFLIRGSFLVEDQYGNALPDATKFITLSAVKITLNKSFINNTYFTSIDRESLDLINCDSSNFSLDSQNAFYYNNLEYSICINKSLEIGGYYDNDYNSYIQVLVKKCSNSSDSNITCHDDHTISNFMVSDYFLTFYYEEINYNPKNYSYPMTFFLKQDSFPLDIKFHKTQIYTFQEFTINTDFGLLYGETFNKTNQRFDSRVERFEMRADTESIIDIRIYTSIYSVINFRTYMKISDLIVSVSTFANILYQIFDTLIGLTYREKMDELILNALFDIRTVDFEMDMPNKELSSLRNFEKDEIKSKISSSSPSKDNSIAPLSNSKIQEIDINPKLDLLIKRNEIDFLSITKKRKKEREGLEYNLSFSQIAISSFCPCHCSKRLMLKEMIKKELFDYVIEYTDLLNVSKSMLELEKLKFALLTEEQLALFNLIAKPQNPKKHGSKNIVTRLYEYSKNVNLQKSILRKLNDKKSDIRNLSVLHQRFIEMIEYQK